MSEHKAELAAICAKIAACEDPDKIERFLAFAEGFAAALDYTGD